MEEPAGERGIYTRNDLIRFVSTTIKWSTPNKEQHGEKNIDCNRCITNVTVTEKYSNIRPSEVDYIFKEKQKTKKFKYHRNCSVAFFATNFPLGETLSKHTVELFHVVYLITGK